MFIIFLTYCHGYEVLENIADTATGGVLFSHIAGRFRNRGLSLVFDLAFGQCLVSGRRYIANDFNFLFNIVLYFFSLQVCVILSENFQAFACYPRLVK